MALNLLDKLLCWTIKKSSSIDILFIQFISLVNEPH